MDRLGNLGRGAAREFVLSVGRVEARKGQLTVARVLESLGVPGIFVGAANSRHQAYVAEFRRLVER